jgi:flavin reductase (DIM6/NTAB) family NADH-FMN oxidoreductase RutF
MTHHSEGEDMKATTKQSQRQRRADRVRLAGERAEERLEERFKEAFMRLAATVTVISYHTADDDPAGMTATSVCSLSLVPLSLLVCVNRETKSHEAIAGSGRFGVNVLSLGQEQIAEYCSRPGEHKTLPGDWLLDASEAATPVLRRALAHLDCEVSNTYAESTHSIFIGNVAGVWLGPAGEPLLYSNRSYRDFRSEAEAEAFESLWGRLGFGALS